MSSKNDKYALPDSTDVTVFEFILILGFAYHRRKDILNVVCASCAALWLHLCQFNNLQVVKQQYCYCKPLAVLQNSANR